MKKILIVEDDRTFASLLAELFELEGFACITAFGAADAEKQFPLLGKEIHVVILDLMMLRSGSFVEEPTTNLETGDEIYDKMRSICPSIPIIIITAKTPDNVRENYKTDKNTWIFFKPINEILMQEIVTILRSI